MVVHSSLFSPMPSIRSICPDLTWRRIPVLPPYFHCFPFRGISVLAGSGMMDCVEFIKQMECSIARETDLKEPGLE